MMSNEKWIYVVCVVLVCCSIWLGYRVGLKDGRAPYVSKFLVEAQTIDDAVTMVNSVKHGTIHLPNRTIYLDHTITIEGNTEEPPR